MNGREEFATWKCPGCGQFNDINRLLSFAIEEGLDPGQVKRIRTRKAPSLPPPAEMPLACSQCNRSEGPLITIVGNVIETSSNGSLIGRFLTPTDRAHTLPRETIHPECLAGLVARTSGPAPRDPCETARLQLGAVMGDLGITIAASALSAPYHPERTLELLKLLEAAHLGHARAAKELGAGGAQRVNGALADALGALRRGHGPAGWTRETARAFNEALARLQGPASEGPTGEAPKAKNPRTEGGLWLQSDGSFRLRP